MTNDMNPKFFSIILFAVQALVPINWDCPASMPADCSVHAAPSDEDSPKSCCASPNTACTPNEQAPQTADTKRLEFKPQPILILLPAWSYAISRDSAPLVSFHLDDGCSSLRLSSLQAQHVRLQV